MQHPGPTPGIARSVRPRPNVIEVVLWLGLIALVALGIVSVGIWWLFPFAAAAQLEPLRQSILIGTCRRGHRGRDAHADGTEPC
jgi:hypothetical protein